MTIKAKYAGTCTRCGGSISPGDLIEWSRGAGSHHVTCSKQAKSQPKSQPKSSATRPPLNSPGRAALQGRDSRDFFIGEKTDIALGFTSRSKPAEDRLGQTIHETKGEYAGRYLTCVGLAAHYVSQDEADDFDLAGPGGSFESHWSLLKYFRPATEGEAAALAAQERTAATAKRFGELCDRVPGGEWVHDFDRSGRLRPEIDAEAGNIASWVLIWEKLVGYSLRQAWCTPIGLISVCPVYDDSPTWRLLRWDAMSAEDAEMIRDAKAVEK